MSDTYDNPVDAFLNQMKEETPADVFMDQLDESDYGLDEDESYGFGEVKQLIETGPKLLQFKEEQPELYQAIDEGTGGLLSDFENWYDTLVSGSDAVEDDLKKFYAVFDKLQKNNEGRD